MFRRKTEEHPCGATDERECVILSEAVRRSRRIRTGMLLLSFILVGCTDYAAQMEDDFEEWRAAQLLSSEDDESSSSVTPGSSSVKSQSSSSVKSSSSVSSSSSEIKLETLTDERDGQTYKIVTIGSQTWMAQNLNYETTNSYCYGDKATNCTKYGRLYTWAAAVEACPSGWHLPDTTEWNSLASAVGGESIAVGKLKSASGWSDDGNGSDAYAFSILPAGYYDNGKYISEGVETHFWESTELDSRLAYHTKFDRFSFGGWYSDCTYKSSRFSVRCVKDDGETAESSSSKKDESSSSSSVKSSSSAASSSSEEAESSSSKTAEPAVGTLTDSRDGQTYKTVKIGDQVWMAENLNFAYTSVPYDYAGSTSDSTSWCYGDDPANCAKYGRLYTWSTAMDSTGTWAANGKGCGYNKTCSPTYPVRGICPEGWHLPSQTEWNTLFTAVGDSSTAGKMLKSTSGWFSDYNGTDAYSFSALPAGYRSFDGDFDYEGDYARFWSSTEYSSSNAYYMDLRYINESAELRNASMYYGHSVRCVKD